MDPMGPWELCGHALLDEEWPQTSQQARQSTKQLPKRPDFSTKRSKKKENSEQQDLVVVEQQDLVVPEQQDLVVPEQQDLVVDQTRPDQTRPDPKIHYIFIILA